MKPKDAKTVKYVRQQLGAGNFVPVVLEGRSDGAAQLIGRAELHTREALRERQIIDALPGHDEFTTTAINPANGLFGVYQVPPPNLSLPFEGDDGSGETAAKADVLAKKTLEIGRISEVLAKDIAEGRLQAFSELEKSIPEGLEKTEVLALLTSIRKPKTEFETSHGIYKTGGHPEARTSLPLGASITMTCNVNFFDEARCGKVGFGVTTIKGDVSNLLRPILSQRRVFAELATSDNKRAMALIYFSRLHEVPITFEVMPLYEIEKSRWTLTITDILGQSELLAFDRPAREFFD